MRRLLLMAAAVAFAVVPVSLQQSAVSASHVNLAGLWHLDSIALATTPDSSGHSNDGVVVGGAALAAGKFSAALSCDGTDDYVVVGTSPTLDIAQGTWEAWVKFATKPSTVGHRMNPLAKQEQYWIHAPDVTNPAIDNSLRDAIQVKINVAGTRYVATTGADFIEPGRWYHVAGTYDTHDLKLYVNGELKDTNSAPEGALNVTGNSLNICTWSTPVDFFQGAIDEVRVWKRVLSADEVMATAQAGLRALWRLNDSAADASGYGNNGTLNGTPAFATGKFGSALALDSADDYVQVANSSSLEPKKITVEGWVKGTNPGSYRYILAKGASGCTAASYAFYTGGSGGLFFYISNGSSYVLSPNGGAGVWDGNNWHHIAGTFDGATVRLYVDAAEVGSGTASAIGIGYGLPTTNDLFIGRYHGSCVLSFVGSIDEMHVWSRALTAEEIDFLASADTAAELFVPTKIKEELSSGAVFTSEWHVGTTNPAMGLAFIVPETMGTGIQSVAFRSATPAGTNATLVDYQVGLGQMAAFITGSHTTARTLHLDTLLTDSTKLGMQIQWSP